MSTPLFQTVTALNYLPMALVLADSLRQHVPSARVCTLVTDVTPPAVQRLKEHFGARTDMIGCDELGCEAIAAMRSYYSVLEFNSACKALALDYQLRVRGEPECLFLDPDMLALGDLSTAHLAAGRDLVVTAHTLSPYPEDGELPNEGELAMAGYVNGGYFHARQSGGSAQALAWLVRQTRYNWFVAPLFGLYGDQHWLDLMLLFFPQSAGLLRDPAINIAYFNLHERPLREEGGRVLAGDRPALLFHFSGTGMPVGERLTRHTVRRFDAVTEHTAMMLLSRYRHAVDAAAVEVRAAGVAADLGFSRQPLHARIKRAEDRWGIRYREVLPQVGRFARFGRAVDRLLG